MNGPSTHIASPAKSKTTLKDIARFAVRRAIADVLARQHELQAQEKLSDTEMQVVVTELKMWQGKIDPLGASEIRRKDIL